MPRSSFSQPGGAREGDELPRPPERVLQAGREQVLDRELGDELVEPDALALVDRAQQPVRVAEAGGGDGTHRAHRTPAPRARSSQDFAASETSFALSAAALLAVLRDVAPALLREVVAPAPVFVVFFAADGFDADRFAAGLAGDALAAEPTDFRVEPEAAAFDADDLAAGFAAPAFGFEAAVDFGFDAAVDFGFDAAVADRLRAAGLRPADPDARPSLADAARAVRVEPDVALPVFAPAARGAAGVSARAGGDDAVSPSSSRRRRSTPAPTTLRPCSSAESRMFLGERGMR